MFYGQNVHVRLPKDKPRALEEDPSIWSNTAWQCASTRQKMDHVWTNGASMPPLNSSTQCRGEGYSPCVDRRGVDAIIVPQIANPWNSLACTVSELIDEVQDERGWGSLIHKRSIVLGRVFCLI